MRLAELLALADDVSRPTAGVLRTSDLGLAPSQRHLVGRLVTARTWMRLERGVVLVEGEPGPVQRAHAAVLHTGGTVTGLAAARLMGWRWVPEGERVQVLIAPHVRRASTPMILVRRSPLDPPRWFRGLPLAPLPRVLVDGARECTSLRDVRGLVLAALADHVVTPDALRTALIGEPSSAWCRRALRDFCRGATSPPEAEAADELRGCGLPYLINAEVRKDGVLIAVLDVYLVGTGVGAELDSLERHAPGPLLDATLERHGRLERVGLEIEHLTPTRQRAQPGLLRRRLLARVAARTAGEPAGITIVGRGPVLR